MSHPESPPPQTCPTCGNQSTDQSYWRKVGDIPEVAYLCAAGHGWITKWWVAA